MIADLGGMVRGIVLIATALNFYFSNKLYFKDLINSNIYSLEEPLDKQLDANSNYMVTENLVLKYNVR